MSLRQGWRGRRDTWAHVPSAHCLQKSRSVSVCQAPEAAPSLRLDSLSLSCDAELPFAILLTASVQGAPKEVVDPSSGRATLLESIRQAGGIGKAKLRSVKERKLEKKKQKEQEQGEGRRMSQ